MKFLEEQDLRVENQSRYIQNYRKYPLYQNTDECRTAKTGIYRLKELLLRLIAPLL